LYFEEGYLAPNYYTQFTNQRQKFSEDLASLGSDTERLSCLAYPERESKEVRDKIVCAQFIALSDGFIKRIRQLKGIVSLKTALEKAMAIKIIQENCFENKVKGIFSNEIKKKKYYLKENVSNVASKGICVRDVFH